MKKQLKQGLRAGLAFACTLSLILSVTPVQADEIDDLKAQTASLEEQTAALEDQLANINQELLAISNEITTTEIQIELTNEEILATQQELSVATENKDLQYQDMKDRIKYIYENGSANWLEMLFSAKNIADFVNKADFIQNISEYDREMLNEFIALEEEIEQKEQVLSEQQASLLELQDQLTSRQASLAATAEATSTDLAEFNAQIDALVAEQARLTALAIAEAKAKAEAEAQAQANANKPTNSGSGSSGTVITGSSVNASKSDLDILAALIQCEAYQNYDYLLAVATVIMNRVTSPLFPNTVYDVAYASGQFVTAHKIDSLIANNRITSLSYKVAQDALNGARLLAVADCYYFLAASSTSRAGVNIGGNLFFQKW